MRAARPAGRHLVRVSVVALLFVVLTAVMTWPQVAVIATHGREHQDVYFNLWRLGWVAHALRSDPSRLFDGNIFHPEPRTLTFSDAMLVQGAAASPLLWAGLPPLLVHNLLLLGAIVFSAVAMYVLVRRLTGSDAAGIVAGIVFAFVPYRFEHYMHLELQWTMWIPLAFWALHRTLQTASWRDGVLTGLFVSLQMLSSIYYGVFLATLLGVSALLFLASAPPHSMWPAVRGLLPGALLAAVLCGAYAVPYLQTKSEVGARSEVELMTFSARPSSYLVATPDNRIWGRAFAGRGRLERRLFPGLLCVLLALVGLLLRPPTQVVVVYLLALVLAFEMSLGLSGYSYRFLYDHIPIYQGLRAIARLGIFVVFFLAVLAAFGFDAVARSLPPRARMVVAVAVCLVLLAEYRVRPLGLVPYVNTPPPLYAWLARQPDGVVAELPLGSATDPAYTYLSTFHWHPLVNGYSGVHPASYLRRLDALAGFPDARSVRQLRADGVRYVIVHLAGFQSDTRPGVAERLTAELGASELIRLNDGRGDAIVFGLR